MAENAKVDKVEEVKIEVGGETKPAIVETKMTVEEMETAGFKKEEIEMAKKQGMIKEPVEKKPEEIKKPEPEKQPDPGHTREELEKKLDTDGKLSPTHEKDLLGQYNKNEQALYFKQKKERRLRQEAQQERDLYKLQVEALRNTPPQKIRVDDDGNPIPEVPDNEKYLTVAELKDIEEKKQKEKELKNSEQQIKVEKIKNRMMSLEEEGKTKYSDFGSVMGLAKQVLDTRFSNSAKVRALYHAFVEAINTDNSDESENAADIAYEIGKLHPDYKVSVTKPEEGNTEDKIKIDKILANKDKQKPSAAVGGGSGKRVVSESDLTLDDVVDMSTEKWRKLKPETRERLLRATSGG